MRLTPLFSLVLVAILSASGARGGLLERLRVEPDGSFALGETWFRIQHFAPGWQCQVQGDAIAPGIAMTRNPDGFHFVGSFPAKTGAVFQFAEQLVQTEDGTVRYRAELASDTAVATEQLVLGVFLPVDLFIGVPLELGERRWVAPEEPFADPVLAENLTSLVIPVPEGRLVFTGTFGIQIEDGRNFADKRHFRFRFHFSPKGGSILSSSMQFAMRLEPYDTEHPKPTFGKEYTLVENEDWQPLEHRVSTAPGSILDWSGMTEGPAGAHGPVVIRDGHFVLAGKPDQPLRFFGTNICDRANYQDQAGAEALAAQLVRLGHNTVRLHHYDRYLVARGKTLAEGWDEAALDQLDLLFAALKRQGLYISIDLYTIRVVTAAEIEEVDHDVFLNEFKALVALSPSARANWKEFARRLLTHVNPHTGLAWKDDPALFSICLLNENYLPTVWDASPATARLYHERFAQWCRDKGRALPEREVEKSQPWAEFLIETHREMYRDCAAFVRSLGTHALLTDANFRADLPLALLRQEFDYVDSHAYFDHRTFLGAPFRLPYRYRQLPPLATDTAVPHVVLASRHFGQPFLVTEFNYNYPNRHRAVGGALFGAYAALQDWDGLYRYAYSHQVKRMHEPDAIFYLDNVGDPLNLLADRMAVLLFRRGDVRPATGMLPFLYGEEALQVESPLDRKAGWLSPDYCRLAYRTRIGFARADQVPTGSPAVAKQPAGEHQLADGGEQLAKLAAPNGQLYESETGQIRLDTKEHHFAVVTPGSEILARQEDGEMSGQTVRAAFTGGGVVGVAAMDGRPVAESRRLLVFHLTDVQNTGVTFRDPGHTVLTAWGGLPHLVRRGTASLRLDFADARPGQVYELNLDGSRRGAWPGEWNGTSLVFTAQTITPAGTRLLYEIVRSGP